MRPSSPLQSSLIFLPITTSMSLLVGLFEVGSPKKVLISARSEGKLVRRNTELPIFALPASPLTGLYNCGRSQAKRVATSSSTLAMPSPANLGPLRTTNLGALGPPSSSSPWSSPSPGSAAPAEAAAWSILSVSAVSKSSQFFRDRSCHFPMVEGGMEKKSVEL